MNIFASDPSPYLSAKVLPDKHIVKMPLECCQMLSIIFSNWYYDWAPLPKKDGGFYATTKGAFRNHPSTKWAGENHYNTAWLIQHGCALASEYRVRYGKVHSCTKLYLKQRKYFIAKQTKQLYAILWRRTFLALCQMSSNMMIALIPLLHIKGTLLPNLG